MTLSRRERFLIIFGLITVTLVAYIFYFLIPYINNTGDARTKLATAQSEISILNAKANASGVLAGEIEALQQELAGRGSSIPTAMDHARVLLYLQKLAGSRSENLSVQFTGSPEIQDRLIAQAVTVEFRTTWRAYRKLLDEFKKNELYHRVEFVKAGYAPEEADTQQAAGQDGETKTENVIAVLMELRFYAFQPEDGQPVEPPLPPANTGRTNSLFPDR